MPRLRHLICFGLVMLSAIPLPSQNAGPETTGTTVKAKSQLVVVDVVVTDANGSPIRSLRKEDFKILEDGKAQTISAFEEHTGKAPAPITPPVLPPDTYSNAPRAEAPDSLTVVLLDSLNTPIQDQSYVHQQVFKYLNGIHTPGPIAVFILSNQLRMVHGFTDDLSALLAALHDKNSKSSPQTSPLLRMGGEVHAQEQQIGQMEDLAAATGGGPSSNLQAFIDALRQVQAEQAAAQTGVRVQTTISALQQLARYLSAFPGRKNVVWFSSAFPLQLFRDPSQASSIVERDFQDDVRRASNDLMRARVAIYPVDAEGVAPDSLYDASALPLEVHSAQQATAQQVQQLSQGSLERTGSQAAMDEFARQTGGRAFYNTNALDEALVQAIKDGSSYYTLDYVPTNKNLDGRFRRIQVKLKRGHFQLSYRRGYNADDERTARAVTQKLATQDPLQPLMAPGLPNFAQIRYLMSVKPSTPQPEMTAQRAGDNTKLEGPFTRLNVDLAISERTLELQTAPDGTHHGTLEFALVAFDHYGNQMNWLVRTMEISLSPERYKAFWDVGIQFHFEFDAPRGAAYLRSGVCDTTSQKAGTIEVSLNAPTVPQAPRSN